MGQVGRVIGDAVDAYLKAYVDAAVLLGAGWTVVHAGFHFSDDVEMRMRTGLDRLIRLTDYAEKKGSRVLLENLNKEPADAEVHYLAHTSAEWAFYYNRIDSPAFGLSFTANHAHLVPEGVEAFVAAIPLVGTTAAWASGSFVSARLPLSRRAQMALAMAIVGRPELVFVDEPTAGMSVDEVPVILDLIRALKQRRDCTILLVEHKMDVVRELADRIIVLHQGKLVADGDPATVIASPIVQEAYLGVAA